MVTILVAFKVTYINWKVNSIVDWIVIYAANHMGTMVWSILSYIPSDLLNNLFLDFHVCIYN